MRGIFGAYAPIKFLLLFFAGPTLGWGFVPLVAAVFYWLLLVKEALISDAKVSSSACGEPGAPGLARSEGCMPMRRSTSDHTSHPRLEELREISRINGFPPRRNS